MDQSTDDVEAVDALQHYLPLLLTVALASHDDVDDVSQSNADRIYDAGDQHPIVLLAEVVCLLRDQCP